MRRREVLASACGLVLAGCLGGDGEHLQERGTISIVIDDEPVDLSADRFQAEHAADHSIDFHFHEFDDYWYIEGTRRVTLGEGIDVLPHFAYEHQADAHILVVDGTEYRSDDPSVQIDFSVNGEPVDPTTYQLHDGDAIRIEVHLDE